MMIRKPIDYGEQFTALDEAVAPEYNQIHLFLGVWHRLRVVEHGGVAELSESELEHLIREWRTFR